MRNSLGLLAALALLVSAPSYGQSLRPLSWSEPGLGRLDGADAIRFQTLCRRFFFHPGDRVPIEAGGNDVCQGVTFQGTTPPLDGFFELSSNLGVFSARVVSEVKGNTWTLGVRDMRFEVRQLPRVGSTVQEFQYGWMQVRLVFDGFASFDAPKRRPVGGVDVAVRASEHFPPLNQLDLESQLLGAFPGTVLTPVSTWVAGDRVRVYASHLPWIAEFTAKSLADASHVVQEVSLTAETPCGDGSLDDCTSTLELFEPGP